MKDLKRNYKIETFTITKENISKFKVMDNRRNVSENHVRKIHGAILSGKNPLGVLIVNNKNKEWRLIDGNHRIEAVRKFYSYKKAYGEVKIDCIVKIYENLTTEEERQIYSDEARRRNESHEDRLTMYKDTITFWKLCQEQRDNFPCKVSIYPQKDSLRFRTILDSLCTIKSDMKNGYCPRYLSKEELILFAQDLGYDDFIDIKNFITLFQEVFGKVSKNNILCRRQGFLPLFDIYMKNIEKIGYDKLKKRMSETLGKSDLLMYLNMQGREAQQKIREIIIGYMNHGIRKNLVY